MKFFSNTSINRRRLLTAGGAAAAAASALRPDTAQAFRATPAEKAGRYQDSAHNRRFYELNRR
jgi:hypothetical protein